VHTFTKWIVSVMEYTPVKSIGYNILGLLLVSGKCAGTLLRCYSPRDRHETASS
jgi:hypothetical protein